MHKRSLLLWILFGVTAVITLLAAWIPLPKYSKGPGPASEVVPLISVRGRPTYDSGTLITTTVSYEQLTGILAVLAWIDPDKTVVDEEFLYPEGRSVALEDERSRSQMDTSKIAATSAVLSTLTRYPGDHGEGALVQEVFPDCPAEGKLFVGDLIGSIDGAPIGDVEDASEAIAGAAPGDPLTFHVSGGGSEHDVTLARGRCPGSDRPVVGIGLVNDFPFDVEIASGDVGGPSAGLMWGLGLYDLLTPGDLTGGRLVAGTGEMSTDGTVESVGGITDKVVAARNAGAQVFVLPEDNLQEAETADRGDMELIPVASFTEALTELGVELPDEASAAS